MTEQRHGQLAATIRGLMPQLTEELRELVAIPSVSVAGYPTSTHGALSEAQSSVTRLLRDAGCQTVDTIELPDTAPVVFAEIPAPDRGSHRAALQPLRRGARRGRVAVGDTSVRAHRA